MRLRNKKTGEIIEALISVYGISGDVVVSVIDGNSEDGYTELGRYKTLTELNEEWEDYKPAEPLIKDEKIRKAVRAWAEANVINDLVCYATENGFKFAGNPISLEIRFNQTLEIDTDGIYTITELCGGEE